MNRFLPLQVVCFYIAFTLFLAVFGPVFYFGFDVQKTVFYMVAMLASIIAGYVYGVRKPLPLARASSARPVNVDRIFNISLGLSLLGLAATVLSMIASNQFNTNLSGLGSTYADYYQDYTRNSGNYSSDFIIYTLSAAPTFIATIWGLFYFKRLSFYQKLFAITVILGNLFTFTIGSGKQKELGNIIVYALAVFAIKSASKGKILTPRNLVIGVLVLVIGIFGFTFILSQRYSAISIDVTNINSHVVNLIAFDKNSFVFSLLGERWGLAMAIFLWYLSQGYFGLSLSLNTPTTWTYMVGSSYSMSVISNQLLGFPFQYYNTYPYLAGAQSGWGESHWYTVFPWFASDFGFAGTVVLFGIFSYAYARCWIEAVRYKNPFSIMLFCLLTLGAAFIPANNQLVHSPAALMTMAVVLLLYFSYRRQFNDNRLAL